MVCKLFHPFSRRKHHYHLKTTKFHNEAILAKDTNTLLLSIPEIWFVSPNKGTNDAELYLYIYEMIKIG